MENANNPCHLCLEGELTIYTAMDTKQRLMKPLASCQQLEVDLSQVSEMDSAGVQLMLLAKREANAQGKDLRFVGHSTIVADVLELYQLTGYFGDPIVMASAG